MIQVLHPYRSEWAARVFFSSLNSHEAFIPLRRLSWTRLSTELLRDQLWPIACASRDDVWNGHPRTVPIDRVLSSRFQNTSIAAELNSI